MHCSKLRRGYTYNRRMDADRKFLLILAAAVIPFAVIMTLALTKLFGPSELGIRCSRVDGAVCRIHQSRLLGAAGNSSVEIPQSRITAVRTECGQRSAVGGRRATSCSVELMLADEPYPSWTVLSFPLFNQAQSAARRLNAYLADPNAPSIDLKEPVGSIVLLYGGAPLALLGIVLGLRSRLRREP